MDDIGTFTILSEAFYKVAILSWKNVRFELRDPNLDQSWNIYNI
jgi:hypothetical protein